MKMPEKKILFGGLMLFVFTATVLLLVFLNAQTKAQESIRTIKIEKTGLIPEREYAKAAMLTKGVVLTKDSLPKIRERLLKHPFVSGVNIEVHSDSLLTIVITEKAVDVLLLSGDKKFLVGRSGQLLQVTATVKEFDLPVLTAVSEKHITSGVLQSAVTKTIQGIIQSVTAEHGFAFGKLNEIRWSEGKDIIVSFSETAPLFVLRKSNVVQGVAMILALAAEQHHYKETIQKTAYIDVRYSGKIFAGYATVKEEEKTNE